MLYMRAFFPKQGKTQLSGRTSHFFRHRKQGKIGAVRIESKTLLKAS